ncbi:MAG: hypothetical protein IAF94_06780 [Pirellulaceae bacterium]|nr:hypothetical protein [Pirellulaceae bacterium]
MRALLVAALHVGIVLSLAGKLLWDRKTSPRVWAKTVPYDPSTPLRGRYVSLWMEVVPSQPASPEKELCPCRLVIENQRLTVKPDAKGSIWTQTIEQAGETGTLLSQRVAFFIPEHIQNPSVRAAGEELWAEVTVPPSGPPRPIRLGVKKDGVLTPLN